MSYIQEVSKFRKMLLGGVPRNRVYTIKKAQSVASSILVFMEHTGNPVEGGNLLDVGCEYGLAYPRFTKMGFVYYGIEFVPEHLRICELLDIPVMEFDLENGDYSTLSQFQYIFCRHVVEHLEEPEVIVSKLIAHLNVGGYLFVQSAVFTEKEKCVHIHPFRSKEEFKSIFPLDALEICCLGGSDVLGELSDKNGVIFIGKKIKNQSQLKESRVKEDKREKAYHARKKIEKEKKRKEFKENLPIKKEIKNIANSEEPKKVPLTKREVRTLMRNKEDKQMGLKDKVRTIAKRQKEYTDRSVTMTDVHLIKRIRAVMSSVHAFFDQLKLYKERDDEVILDVGCENGLAFPHIKWIGFNYFGIDFIPDLLEICRLTYIPSKWFDLEGSTYDKLGIYDHLFCRYIFEYLNKPKWVLDKLVDNLMPGGLVMIQANSMILEFNFITSNKKLEVLCQDSPKDLGIEYAEDSRVIILRKK